MATTRYYYSSAISEFIGEEENSIVGKLTGSSQHDINKETSSSWRAEIESLKEALKDYSDRGSIYLEYNIPRMGHRVDAIVLIDGIVFILEYKTGRQTFNQSARNQVWDYALDLKNFHADSKDRTLAPIVVVPCALDEDCHLTPKSSGDKVYEPLFTNTRQLGTAIQNILVLDQATVRHSQSDDIWANSGYEPTPTIIEAAIALYEKHSVADITKSGGDIEKTSKALNRIIDHCRKEKRKAICFITGVPGAGKTLIGLNTAIELFNQGIGAVYLSGNYPLVEVLQEALARDYIERKRIITSNEEKKTRPKKGDAKREVKAFIQMIHHYRDQYLEGVDITANDIRPKPGYFESNTDKAYIPAEHVAIFDEAQRAWTKEELQRFMREKKNIQNFPYSEPEYLISCMDRQRDWGVVVCLVGNGQSINKGEAGLNEWIASIQRRYKSWDVYISQTILSKEQERDIAPQLKHQEELHLEMSMRSFRSESVSIFINQLLDLKVEEARSTLNKLKKDNYPIVLTRSLERAKLWLRSKKRGNERMGLLASSKAERLKAISINVKYSPNFVHWFLEDSQDFRSSDTLEDALTEFEVQGLEIDWACVAWDADLRLSEDKRTWEHFQLRGGDKWQNINKPVNQEYQINAYRVLLTRARQGIVILIPEGDDTDTTRKREWYDRTYNYLKGIGIPEIQDQDI
ncbi:MAG: DUF2075 domain-containing protein [Porphyromonadaceae bacterium]|jgi:hypothetical protein|nr:DUF2075 domain-containing protein [Porphyromonadaceae bacterium]MBF1371866.1 DUF2075 domain-containing protein [Porphyromonadaceae bacterium]